MNTQRNTIEISPAGLIFNVKAMELKFKLSGPSGYYYYYDYHYYYYYYY